MSPTTSRLGRTNYIYYNMYKLLNFNCGHTVRRRASITPISNDYNRKVGSWILDDEYEKRWQLDLNIKLDL